MKRNWILSITILAFISISSWSSPFKCEAQNRHYYTQIYSLNYQPTLPLGNSADFISGVSFNGANFNFGYFITDNISAGIDFSWGYNQKCVPAQEYYVGNVAAFYAAAYKTTQTLPIKFQTKYFFNPNSSVRFYAGVGIGATHYLEYIQIQDYQFTNQYSWGFLMSPEVGMLIPFGADSPLGANLIVGYNWATNKAQNLYCNVGIYFSVF